MSKTQELARAIELIDNDCTKAAALLREQEAAMQMALEALERADKISGYVNNKKAIAKLKELLK